MVYKVGCFFKSAVFVHHFFSPHALFYVKKSVYFDIAQVPQQPTFEGMVKRLGKSSQPGETFFHTEKYRYAGLQSNPTQQPQ
jgi:hypothetical protein